MKFSYITNNCLAQVLYFSESREYDSPFIGSIFLNDSQFVKLCQNYDYYISLTPVFSEPKNDSTWCEQNNGPWYKHVEITPGYPVMFLEDIEIHWIHEHNIEILLQKYNRRIERYKQNNLEPLFLLSISDLCNDHSKKEYLKLITNFTKIKNSIYLTKYQSDLKINNNIFLIKDWLTTSNKRNSSHIYEFHNISNREKYFKDIISNKLLNRDLKYSIIMPLKINSLNSCKIFTEISLPLYDKFLETEYLDSFLIICPSNDIEYISKYTNKYPYIPFRFVNEEDILDKNINDVNGWLKQQVIKLRIYSLIKTKHYLVMDSDIYLNQPFKYSDIYHEGKIKYSCEPWQEVNNKYYSTNSNWWKSSCLIINYPIEKIYDDKKLMGVTPQIFIKDKVEELIKFLEITYGKDWQKIICNMKFTEFTLYWLFLLKNNDTTNLYTQDGYPLWNHDLDRNILYYGSEEEHKIITKNSITQNITYFSVIQSYLPVNIDLMKNEIFKIIKPSYDAIFLISSTVTPTIIKFFNIEERFLQTIETVKSIKEKFPNSFCLLIEGSNLNYIHKKEFEKYFDYILELYNDPTVIPYVKDIRNIGHGEQKLLEKGIEFLQNNILPYHTTEYIFKLGARYILSEKFDINNYDKNKYNFYEEFDDNGKSLEVYTTGLYSIPVCKIDEFKIILHNIHNHLSIDTEMVEKYFYNSIPNENINILKILGLEGKLNYNGYFFSK